MEICEDPWATNKIAIPLHPVVPSPHALLSNTALSITWFSVTDARSAILFPCSIKQLVFVCFRTEGTVASVNCDATGTH